MTETAFAALTTLIEDSAARAAAADPELGAATTAARRDAEEFGITVPDEITASLLTMLTAAGFHPKSTGAIIVTPALAVVGLAVLRGLPERTSLTCIDPEAEHQSQAKEALRTAGYRTARGRFLPSRPLDVLGRMALDAYQLVYLDVDPLDLRASISAAWPLLSPGGCLVLADALLDGTIGDLSRTDRATKAAREAFEVANSLREEGAIVTHLPLGAGLTIITRPVVA